MRVARLLAINALIRVAASASGQLFAFLVAERMVSRTGAGSLVVGLLAAAFFVTELLGAPLAGHVADRVGHRRVLGWGPLFGIVSALVAATASLAISSLALLVTVLLVARLNEGASAACAVPNTLVLLSRPTEGDARRRTRVMASFEITSLVGMVAGFAISGLVWDAFGTAAFLILAPLYGAAWALTREDAPQAADATNTGAVSVTLRRLAAQPGTIGFGVAWLAVNAVVGVWLQQAPYLFKLPGRSPDQMLVGGFSGTQIGVIFAVWGITFMAGLVLWSVAGADWPRRRAMLAALGGMLGVVASLAIFNHGGHRAILFVAAGFILVESGFTPAAFSWLADLTEPIDASRGVAMGVYSIVLGAGQLAGSIIGAPFAARWQMDGVLALTALLAAAALAGVLAIPRTRRGAASGTASH